MHFHFKKGRGPRVEGRGRASASYSLVGALLVGSALLLGGCAPALIAVGAAAYGAAVVHDRRSAEAVMNDEVIEVRGKTMYVEDRDLAGHSRVRVVSYNGAVLLAGQAESGEHARALAEQIATLPHVTRVHNEIEIGPNISLSQQGEDAMIATRGDMALASIPIEGFDPTRVKVIVENGAVFLMGLVTPEEGDAAADKLRRLPGVTRVVKLFDELGTGS